MVDKNRTIKKAQSKYREIMPVPKKHSLEECFYCLRGTFFFQFRTKKDKKLHTVRACRIRPSFSTMADRELWLAMYHTLNRPINIRLALPDREEWEKFFRFLNRPILLRKLLPKREQLIAFHRFMNRPILVRSLVMKQG